MDRMRVWLGIKKGNPGKSLSFKLRQVTPMVTAIGSKSRLEQGGAVLRQVRTAKGWVLRDLTPHGIGFGTASHDENGLLNKDMNARSVARLLHVLQPLNPATGSLWTLAAMKHLTNSTSR